VAQKGIFAGGLRHCCSMSKPVDLILGMMAALLMGLHLDRNGHLEVPSIDEVAVLD
jgi:hypothetical protein